MSIILNAYTPKSICDMFHDVDLAIALENFLPNEPANKRYYDAIMCHPILCDALMCIDDLNSGYPFYFLIRDLSYDDFKELLKRIASAEYFNFNEPLGNFDIFKWYGV